MTSTVTYHIVDDIRNFLPTMGDQSVDHLFSSPPFLNLRSYLPDGHEHKDNELGAESTPAEYLTNQLALVREYRRILAWYGTFAYEVGDTRSGSGGAGGDYNEGGLREGQNKFKGTAARQSRNGRGERRRDSLHERGGSDEHWQKRAAKKRNKPPSGWPAAKSLCGIPTLFTWSLAYGRNLLEPAVKIHPWIVRNLCIWARPNPPVGSLGKVNHVKGTGDTRFRDATSYVTVATKSPHRWIDLDAVRHFNPRAKEVSRNRSQMNRGSPGYHTDGDEAGALQNPLGAPPLDWWDVDWDPLDDWQPYWGVATTPYKGAHFATFPVALPKRMIEAVCPAQVCAECKRPSFRLTEVGYTRSDGGVTGSRRDAEEPDGNARGMHGKPTMDKVVTTVGWTDCGHDAWRNGIVFDPFGGSGTTAVAAAQLGRDCVLVDFDHANIDLCDERLRKTVRVHDVQRRGPTVTWTVEPASRQQLEAIAAGQGALFEGMI